MNKIVVQIRYCLLYLFSLLPLRVHYFFASIIAFLLQHLIRYRYATIITNLARSFPQMKYNEITALAGDYYKYMSDLMVESIWDIAHSATAICKRVKVEGGEIVDTLQSKYNKVLIVMGHCGNWELLSAMVKPAEQRDKEGFASHPIYTVYKKARSKTSEILFRKIRMHEYKKFRSEGEMVESKTLVRHILTNKDSKASYVMIADQNPTRGDHKIINFLNQPSMFLEGPEYVAVKLHLPVVFMSMDRTSRGHYTIKFICITEDASKEKSGFVTEKYAQLLERQINNNNVNWLWSHKRWKRKIDIQ